MSNGFIYFPAVIHCLMTDVDHWLYERLLQNFGEFPVFVNPCDVQDLKAIALEMHPRNRHSFEEFIKFVEESPHPVYLQKMT